MKKKNIDAYLSKLGIASTMLLCCVLLIFGSCSDQKQTTKCDWELVENKVNKEIYGGWVTQDGTVYTTGGPSIWISKDGDVRKEVFSISDGFISDVWGDEDDNIYVVGSVGTAGRNDLVGIIILCRNQICNIVQEVNDANLTSVWGWNGEKSGIYASGHNSIAIKYEGNDVEIIYQKEDSYFRDIWCDKSGETVVISGYVMSGPCIRGRLHARTDGEWKEEKVVGADYDLYSVWGSSSNDIYVVGTLRDGLILEESTKSLGIVMKYDGTKWGEMNIGVSDLQLYAIAGNSEKDMYLGGAKWGRILGQVHTPYIGKLEGNILREELRCEDLVNENFMSFAVNGDNDKLMAFSNEGTIWRKKK
jgi:hypothetical protein